MASEQNPQTHKITQQMMDGDAFSQWLGIEVVSAEEGSAILQMTIRKEMTNGFGIAHGGISYSLADSALAFASNNFGRQSVSIETSISHIQKMEIGDVLSAKCSLVSQSHKIGVYTVQIKNQKDQLVADFKGTVYKSSQNWEDHIK